MLQMSENIVKMGDFSKIHNLLYLYFEGSFGFIEG